MDTLPSGETAPAAATAAPPATQDAPPATTPATRALLLATFTAAIFVSAALLFLVQPMFTKMVLPRFGGAPSVWSVAIVFFQAALLAGYAYAHALTRLAPGRPSVITHLAVMVVATFALPLAIAGGWGQPPDTDEALWLIGLFAASIGLPFFALAANSPLLQAWFARTDHPAARDPYFLYAASNVGSFLALIAYPVAIEPLVHLGDQTRLWSFGFYLLIFLIGGCGALLWRSPMQAPAQSADGPADASADAPPTWRDALFWIAQAAVPSGLLVAVTAHISIDVAAVPLLWVLPLALYLLTFVIVFSRRPIIPHWLVVAVQPAFVLALVAMMIFELNETSIGWVNSYLVGPLKTIVGMIAIHVIVFFVCALMCHGELARTRPAPKYLTAFYLWMSAGGVIGGIAAGLLAPHAFNWVAEYPILIALALLCRPGRMLPEDPRWRYALLGGVAAAVVLAVVAARSPTSLSPDLIEDTAFTRILMALMIVSVLFWRAPLALAATVALVVSLHHSVLEDTGVLAVRSFFGVAKVTETADGRYRLLQHGTTLHGGQRIRDDNGEPVTGKPELLMYYWDRSSIAQTFDAAHARAGGPIRYAVIGLGTGSLACKAEPGDLVHYYEIDPAIIHIARDPSVFSFLAECRPNTPVILGDARLTLAEAPDGAYDLIVVDAFTSDAIPIHLITREAMALYLKKLSPHGMVAVHVSNRYLELASVVAGIAAANDAVTRVSDGADVDETSNPYRYTATVAVVARKDEDFGPLAQSSSWEIKTPDPQQWVWTDDYSNIVGAVLRQLQ
jgi:spermidine synthase